MKLFTNRWFRPLAGVCLFFLTNSCTPIIRWIQDPLDSPSCLPDRLLRWSDFSLKQGKTNRAAETAVRFTLNQKTQTLQVVFDLEHSWVRPDLANPQNPVAWRISEQLLAHEQIHYLISCFVVRQANQSFSPDDDPVQMLSLARSVAQRLNIQYDRDTQHGSLLGQQHSWEKEFMRQFEELASGTEKLHRTAVPPFPEF